MIEAADIRTPERAASSVAKCDSLQRLVREFVDARLNDCMNVMAEYPDGHFDLAICDPPYGINVGDNKSGMGRRKGDAKATYKMGDWDSQPPPDEYFRELRRVSKNQIIWGANHYIERMAWNSPCWIIWDKRYSNDVSFAAVELAWTSFRTTAKKFECTPLQAARIHPTQKPVKLYDWLLANYAKPGQRILDTHMGSGSIGIACHYYACPLVACEIDPDYFRAACDRIERETAQADFYLPNDPHQATASDGRPQA